MKAIGILVMLSLLVMSCAHTHPYKTGSYERVTRELRGLTHADAPPMPDTSQFWLEDMPWYGPLAVVGIMVAVFWPVWVWILLWIAM